MRIVQARRDYTKAAVLILAGLALLLGACDPRPPDAGFELRADGALILHDAFCHPNDFVTSVRIDQATHENEEWMTVWEIQSEPGAAATEIDVGVVPAGFAVRTSLTVDPNQADWLRTKVTWRDQNGKQLRWTAWARPVNFRVVVVRFERDYLPPAEFDRRIAELCKSGAPPPLVVRVGTLAAVVGVLGLGLVFAIAAIVRWYRRNRSDSQA